MVAAMRATLGEGERQVTQCASPGVSSRRKFVMRGEKEFVPSTRHQKEHRGEQWLEVGMAGSLEEL